MCVHTHIVYTQAKEEKTIENDRHIGLYVLQYAISVCVSTHKEEEIESTNGRECVYTKEGKRVIKRLCVVCKESMGVCTHTHTRKG